MEKCTAFVLGGGGGRGALQVGALRALLEAGIAPDLLIGTSIGAANAAGLALWGVDNNGLDGLERAWHEASESQMLNPRVGQLILRVLVGRPSDQPRKKIESYFISKGFTWDLRFENISSIRLALVSADLETGQPVIYGKDPADSVLEGLLTSVAVPPWFMPLQKNGQIIMDGGALSNLPIEPALRLGATEIIALDLGDDTGIPKESLTPTQYFEQYLFASSRRHISLETELAEGKGVPVRRMDFRGLAIIPLWDFSQQRMLIQAGYDRAQQMLAKWSCESQAAPASSVALAEKQPA
ncbi:MAG TPA: patatin-like phospholipase family protein [Anaerolineaceae bacterium]|nr:patatin-like phospholipase family protein [Anaerolineaceae bacterium]